jgi:hypothetical protein
MSGGKITCVDPRLFYYFSGPISVVEPITGFIGRSTSIFCQLSLGSTSDIYLQKNGMPTSADSRFRPGINNVTHREFILMPVQGRDNQALFSCGIEEVVSPAVVFLAIGKQHVT